MSTQQETTVLEVSGMHWASEEAVAESVLGRRPACWDRPSAWCCGRRSRRCRCRAPASWWGVNALLLERLRLPAAPAAASAEPAATRVPEPVPR
jgi:hypothetical protein